MSTSPTHTERTDPRIDEEQTHLDAVYGRLDRMRANTRRRLAATLRESAGTPQALSERESYERMYVDDLAKYDAAEHNLYFCLLYTSPSPRDLSTSRMPSSA